MSDAAICPASDAAYRCGPVWEFADRNQNTQSVLDGTVESTGSSGPVSPTVVPCSPSTDLASRRPLTTTPAYAATAIGAR